MTASGARNRTSGKKPGTAANVGPSWPADTVERRPVASLVPSSKNARTHSPEQVEQLAASIQQWGWTAPILIDAQSNIIAGHGRILAAQRLGLAEVPVVVAANWTDAQKKAFAIADNQLPLNANWNLNLLRVELGELKELGFDLGLTGFGELKIDSLFAPDVAGPDPDAAPDVPVAPASRCGDVWICGDHRILCGDATALADVEKILAGELADMRFTDPPYSVDYANTSKDKQRGKHRPILNDNLGNNFEELLRAATANILTATKGAIYVCMSSSELDTLQRAFRDAGGRWSTFVIWSKHTFTLGPRRLPTAVRTDPIWLEGRHRPLLVRRAGPRRRLVLR